MNVSTRAAPSGATTISAANDAEQRHVRGGEHARGDVADVVLGARGHPPEQHAERGGRERDRERPRRPNGQASHTIACPPTSSTGSGTRMSAPRRSAPASSQVPTAAASATHGDEPVPLDEQRRQHHRAEPDADADRGDEVAARTPGGPVRLPRGGADTAGVSGWLAVIRPRAARLPCASPARRSGGRTGRRWPAAPSRRGRPRPRPPRRRARCGAAPPSPCGGGCGS